MTINTIDTTTPLVGLKAGAEVYNANFTDANNAASKEVGTLPAQVPTNADLPEFGTAATKDTGTASGDIPLNSTTEKDYQIGSASFASNTYTFTPKSGVFRALSSGSIIEFDLPSSSTTGQAKVSYNGAASNLNWADNSATVSGDVDSTYTKRIKCGYNGTNWVILSDMSGGNLNGSWVRLVNGVQTITFSRSQSIPITTVFGQLYTSTDQTGPNFPKAFSSSPSASLVSYSTASSRWTWASFGGGLGSNTRFPNYRWYYVVSVTETIAESFQATGRWYN